MSSGLIGLIGIRAEPLASDPDVCNFVVSREVHAGSAVFYRNRGDAAGSPLGERLFAIPGVRTVLVSGNVVTVGKTGEASWTELAKPIGMGIREILQSGVRAVFERARLARSAPRGDVEIGEDVQILLEEEVNPSIASHGGKIALEGVAGGVVRLRMSGGCQGCAASSVTLRQGVEVMIRNAIPEVVEVVDATDHAAGRSPFYAS